MKLVEILAKELAEWPERINKFTCDPNGEIRGAPMTAYDFYPVGHVDLDQRTKDLAGLGDDLPFVDRAQWQAERDRQKGGEWKRHRGGSKCPVRAGERIEVRFRDGDVSGTDQPELMDWKHENESWDIMKYQILSQPQAEEVEMVSVKTIEAMDATDRGEGRIFDSLNDLYAALDIATEAKWEQSSGPLAWRDTIIHCQAIIEDCEREIQRNVDLLDAEGLMMQTDSKKAMQHYVPAADMSDWRNWKAGDLVSSKTDYNGQFTKDKLYVVTATSLSYGSPRVSLNRDDKGEANGWMAKNFEFHSRP